METQKRCVCCTRLFTDESPGIGGVFRRQAKAAGVCSGCRSTYAIDPLHVTSRNQVTPNRKDDSMEH